MTVVPGPRWTLRCFGPLSSGSVLARVGEELRAVLVVKSTFSLAPDSGPDPVAPEPLTETDQYIAIGDARRLVTASDLAPFQTGAGAIVAGHARPPGGRPVEQMAVRFALFRNGQAAINKFLNVIGDRTLHEPSPIPFREMPLVYERAFGGPLVRENLGGAGSEARGTLPNIVDPRDPSRPAGFGPIEPPGRPPWPPADEGGVLQLGADFDPTWFQRAPADQRLPEPFLGDEWIVLDGFHPDLPRIQKALPTVHAETRVFTPSAGRTAALTLVADTLLIDADRLVASVVWRGHLVVGSPEETAGIRVDVALGWRGAPIKWADEAAPLRHGERGIENRTANTLDGTAEIIRSDVERPLLPFSSGSGAPPHFADSVSVEPIPTGTVEMALPGAGKSILPFKPESFWQPPVSASAFVLPLAEPASPPDARVEVPAVPATPPRPSDEVFVLAWYDPACLPDVRRDPRFRDTLGELERRPFNAEFDDPERSASLADVEDRRALLELLTQRNVAPLMAPREDFSRALVGSVRSGWVHPPLLLFAAELEPTSDEVWLLQATIAAVAAEGPNVKASALAATATAFLGLAGDMAAAGVAAALASRLRTTGAETRAAELDAMTRAASLEARRHVIQRVFGQPHVRLTVTSTGGGPPGIVYAIPQCVARLPHGERISSRVLGRVHPSLMDEDGTAVLRVQAIAVVTRRTTILDPSAGVES